MSAKEETKPVRHLAPDIRGDPPASDRRPRASAKIWRLLRSFFPLDLVETRATSSASPRPALTPDAPRYLGIVIERFPSLDVFVDDALYFGDPAVTKKMIEHTPAFYEFATAISGGFSEFRWK